LERSVIHHEPLLTIGPLDVPGLQPRRVRVFMPPRGRSSGYAARGEAAPPVLYMFDGQNVFDDAPSFAGGWRLHEAIRRISPRHHRLPAIVGIDHGGKARIDELSPFPGSHGGGQADALLAWLTGELVPSLCERFGFASGPRNVYVGGSSMGGLCALYAHFRHPDVFGGALCMSPALWFGEQRIFNFVSSQPTPWTSRIYLDAGAREAGGGMLRMAERMAQHLGERGYGPLALHFRPDPKGRHRELDWRRRAPQALRFLFRKAR
jgi:predicted alpha/beta superfamily hydrolase